MTYFAVGIGGIFGAMARYGLTLLIAETTLSAFPYGTLSINLAGCFLLPFIAYGSLLKWQLPRQYLLGINAGFIGSFTTFSTFSVEILSLLRNGELLIVFAYVSISVFMGLAFSWAGLTIAIKLFKEKDAALPKESL